MYTLCDEIIVLTFSYFYSGTQRKTFFIVEEVALRKLFYFIIYLIVQATVLFMTSVGFILTVTNKLSNFNLVSTNFNLLKLLSSQVFRL